MLWVMSWSNRNGFITITSQSEFWSSYQKPWQASQIHSPTSLPIFSSSSRLRPPSRWRWTNSLRHRSPRTLQVPFKSQSSIIFLFSILLIPTLIAGKRVTSLICLEFKNLVFMELLFVILFLYFQFYDAY